MTLINAINNSFLSEEKVIIFKKIINRIKNTISPTKEYLMVRKYFADGGDYEMRFNYNLDEKSIVLDFGGYKGQWASDIFSKYNCKIFIFEPVKSFAERIRKRFIYNKQIEVFQFGLGRSSRFEKIHISADGSSIFGTNSKCEEIEFVDAKEWINKRSIDKIALIKINIEGGEYELLDRLIEAKLIEMIENIQVQFHNISNDSRSHMMKIQKELSKTHELTYQYEFVWENWERKKNKQIFCNY